MRIIITSFAENCRTLKIEQSLKISRDSRKYFYSFSMLKSDCAFYRISGTAKLMVSYNPLQIIIILLELNTLKV